MMRFPVLNHPVGPGGTVWQVVQQALDSVCADGGHVTWLTYNFDAPAEVLVDLASRSVSVQVICAHAQAPVHRGSFDKFKQSLGADSKILYFPPQPNEAMAGDGVVAQHPPMHAKAVLLWHKGQKRDGPPAKCLVGSFNLSFSGLKRNFETVLEAGHHDRQFIWSNVANWYPHLEELVAADCVRTGYKPRDLIKDGPAQQGSRPAPVEPVDVPPPCKPETVSRLLQALHEMMGSYPATGSHRGWQLNEWKRLEAERAGLREDRQTQLLYLPVGVGKTFVALRWLLERLRDKADPGLVLVPNEWIEQTIRGDLARVAERAGMSHTEAMATVRVHRYSTVPSNVSWAAVVVDEVHNWSADGTTAVSGQVAQATQEFSVPTLGLSATPCRMDHDQFEVASFVGKFLGNKPTPVSPGLRLNDAIAMGLISDYQVSPLACREQVVAEYWESEETKRAFGDYAGIVLRDIWRDIANRRASDLASEIVGKLAGRKRIVVFLPPVGDEADYFVTKLNELAAKAFGSDLCFVDFRSRNQADSPIAQFHSFRVHDTKKGAAILVTVDRFGEGVSVPDVDALVMLRATLSPRVAVQALGRGLRLHAGKRDCLVVDGVGFEQILAQWEGPRVTAKASDVPPPSPPPALIKPMKIYQVYAQHLRSEGYSPNTINQYPGGITPFVEQVGPDAASWSHVLANFERFAADHQNHHRAHKTLREALTKMVAKSSR